MYGGNCDAIKDQLIGVHNVYANDYAFAALVGEEKKIVCWGHDVTSHQLVL